MLSGDIGVALRAVRFGHACGVRVDFVLFMAGGTTQRGVGRGGQLLALVVAGYARRAGSLCPPGSNRSPKGEPQNSKYDWGTHYKILLRKSAQFIFTEVSMKDAYR